MTKHTKGEWVLDDRFIRCNGKAIASAWFTGNPDDLEDRLEGESWLDMRHRTEPQRELITKTEPNANAKLIAAAPDLLKALTSAYHALLILVDINGDVGYPELIKQCTEAIKKATK